ncbi:RNA polymerase sigma factor [Mangrovitalea sediminis]|uniref:RNA polymerase sigma factor n=1 Tax=Mangrovitalea sediminis TaxID=1982043 RepID=UPI000BE5AE20|nr:RNA polymerase sigma factor [Mangrovitalea sediminis]
MAKATGDESPADALIEDTLIAGLRAGDAKAYQDAVRCYSSVMLATARGMLDPAAAEDVVQDTWLAVVDAIHKFEGRSSLKTWLCTIVANRARNRLRKSSRETLTDITEWLEPDMADRFASDGHWGQPTRSWGHNEIENLFEQHALQDCLDKHIERLPENQRSVLTLTDLKQLSADDVCNILEMSASNVRVALHRARQRLFTMIEGFRETGEC